MNQRLKKLVAGDTIFLAICLIMFAITAFAKNAYAKDGGTDAAAQSSDKSVSQTNVEADIVVKYQKLADKIKYVPPNLWKNMVAHERWSSALNAVIVLGLVGLALLIRNASLKAMMRNDGEDRSFFAGVVIWATVIGIILAIISIFVIGSALKSMTTPEYYVMMELFKEIK